MINEQGAKYDVLRFCDIDSLELTRLLSAYRIELCPIADNEPVPGSFWGEEEAGLIGNHLYLNTNTPIHSILHEACHYICMDANRRQSLDTNAGSDDDEENAVCYLQILLSKKLPIMGQARMFRDMDSWGYSFRLGSARIWFEQDATEARDWLLQYQLVDSQNNPEIRLR